jgi:hypothetical protein
VGVHGAARNLHTRRIAGGNTSLRDNVLTERLNAVAAVMISHSTVATLQLALCAQPESVGRRRVVVDMVVTTEADP